MTLNYGRGDWICYAQWACPFGDFRILKSRSQARVNQLAGSAPSLDTKKPPFGG